MGSQRDAKPLAFPVDMYETPFVASILDTTIDELVGLFGKPEEIHAPGDPGPMERWAFQYPCGLRLVYTLDVYHQQTHVTPDVPEIAHVSRHLPFDSNRVNLVSSEGLQAQIEIELQYNQQRQLEFDALDVAQVWRQGEDGNKFTVGDRTSERDAKCLVAELESHGHKQLYWYTVQ